MKSGKLAKADILRDELIGENAKIVKSSNPRQAGIEGKVIDETRDTITLRTAGGRLKKVVKKQVAIMIKGYIIPGAKIAARPEDRIKLKVK